MDNLARTKVVDGWTLLAVDTVLVVSVVCGVDVI